MSTLRPMPALLFFLLAFGISSVLTNVPQGALAMSSTGGPAATPSSDPPAGGSSSTNPTPPTAAPAIAPSSDPPAGGRSSTNPTPPTAAPATAPSSDPPAGGNSTTNPMPPTAAPATAPSSDPPVGGNSTTNPTPPTEAPATAPSSDPPAGGNSTTNPTPPTAAPAAASSDPPAEGNLTTNPTPPTEAPAAAPSSDPSAGGNSFPGNWRQAHATFYGDETASETMGGACGFGNLFNAGYGTDTAALSTTLFHNGFSCGQCYQIQCTNSPHCFPGSPTVTITATNICPPNWAQDSNDGGWCNPPRDHFDMAKPAFMKIAKWQAGIVPVNYRRVPCEKKGGVRFMFQGNDYWLLVYVINVAGSGDISSMSVKGANTDWIPMSHNWGASYQAFASLAGQPLSFQVTSYTTKQTMTFDDVAPDNWNVGLTYEANTNFHL